MCPVAGPVVLSKFQPSSGKSTIALTKTVGADDCDSDVALSTGWRLEKNKEGTMYALSFDGRCIINSGKKLKICTDNKSHFIWKFIDCDKDGSHAVYCTIKEDDNDVKMAWVADGTKPQISLKKLVLKEDEKPDPEFRFVFKSLDDGQRASGDQAKASNSDIRGN